MQPNQLPHLIEIIQALGPTVVAVVLGCFAAYISWRQWWTGNYRLRLDMFDRRYAVYDATKLLVDKITLNDQVTSSDFIEFRNNVRGAEFIFDGETREFLQQLIDFSWKAYMARSRQDRTKDDQKFGKLLDEEIQYLERVQAEGPRLEKIFAKYLNLSQIGL
jgi:hypothetical protein